MEASIECALARVTTGEWAGTLRGVWGEYRAQTGIAGASIARGAGDGWDALRARVARAAAGGRSCSSASPASTVTPTAPR